MQPSIERLTHVGIHVNDLAASIAFYRDILGLTVTDDDRAAGLVFLSSHPDDEHHEILLTAGRTFDPDDNICEVYWPTGLRAKQGYLIGLDFNLSETELLDQVRKSVAEHGRDGIVDFSLLAAQKIG